MKGMKIVLISRNKGKLQQVSEEIRETIPGTTIKAIEADFSRTDIYDFIKQELNNLDIAILINNVGVAPDNGLFLDVPNRYCIYWVITCMIFFQC